MKNGDLVLLSFEIISYDFLLRFRKRFDFNKDNIDHNSILHDFPKNIHWIFNDQISTFHVYHHNISFFTSDVDGQLFKIRFSVNKTPI